MLAIVSPGQGAQQPGLLGPWLAMPGVADRIADYSAVADLDLAALGTTADAETIRDTAVAQPLLVATGLAASALLLGALPWTDHPLVAAGHSVGEITAAVGAGVLTATDGMAFVAERGRAMAEAAAATPTSMTAVLGGEPDEVLAVLARCGLTTANRNGAGQIVAAGTVDQLAALAAAPPARARLVPLAVAGAFHTRHMAPAVRRLAEMAAGLTPADPTGTYLSDADGARVTSGPEVLARLVAQVAAPVRWDAVMATMATLGVTGMLELPPSGTLVGIAKRNLPGIEVFALHTPDELAAARAFVARHAGGTA